MSEKNISIKYDKNHINFNNAIDFFENMDLGEREFESLTKDEINDYQSKRLRDILEFANNNRFYHEKIKNSLNIEEVDFLTKGELRDVGKKLISVSKEKIAQIFLTTGSTGKPSLLHYSFDDLYLYDLLPKYTSLFPFSADRTVGIALPFEFALPAQSFHRLFQHVNGLTVISLGKGGYLAPVDKQISLLIEEKIEILVTTPSYLAILIDRLREDDISIEELNLRTILLTGEPCSDNYRKK